MLLPMCPRNFRWIATLLIADLSLPFRVLSFQVFSHLRRERPSSVEYGGRVPPRRSAGGTLDTLFGRRRRPFIDPCFYSCLADGEGLQRGRRDAAAVDVAGGD